MNEDKCSLWIDSTRTRYFLIPENQDIPTGDLILFNLTGKKKIVSPIALTSFEITEVEARTFLETELNQLIEQIEISEEITNKLPSILEEFFSSSNIEQYLQEIVSQLQEFTDQIDQSPELVGQKIDEIITSLGKDLFIEEKKRIEEQQNQEYSQMARNAIAQSFKSRGLRSFAGGDFGSETQTPLEDEQK